MVPWVFGSDATVGPREPANASLPWNRIPPMVTSKRHRYLGHPLLPRQFGASEEAVREMSHAVRRMAQREDSHPAVSKASGSKGEEARLWPI
jgi:hypothetical protein